MRLHLFLVFVLLGYLNLHAQIRVKAVGDVMLGSQTPRPVFPPNEGKFFKDSIAHHLDSADVTFVNLEGVFVEPGISPQKCRPASREAGKCYEFGMPRSLSPVLKDLHFNVASQDNNHASDYGSAGQRFTKKLLDSLDIACISKKSFVTLIHEVETYDSISETVQLIDSSLINIDGMDSLVITKRDSIKTIVITNKDSIKIAFTAFGHSSASYQVFDIPNAVKVVNELQEAHDLVFISFHGGAEGLDARHTPNKTEFFYGENRGNLIAFSHALIDAGADLIIGHGPHVLRGIELYKNKLICYSLGNFLTFGNISIRGVKGHGAIMDLQIDEKTGDFISGQVIATKQVGRGIPVYDKNLAAVNEIKELSAADFPNSKLEITNVGKILKK